MPLVKTQAEGINLADTFAFTGTVSGAGDSTHVELLDVIISSPVSQYDISSTYINSTYDEYLLLFNLTPEDDSRDLYARVFVGGSIKTAGIYAYEADLMSSTSNVSDNGTTFFRLNVGGIGSDTGEQISGNILLQNVNNSLFFNYSGFTQHHGTNAEHQGCVCCGGLKSTDATNVVNGWRFYFDSGNIESGTIKLFGIRK
jgi:hypothetical protein